MARKAPYSSEMQNNMPTLHRSTCIPMKIARLSKEKPFYRNLCRIDLKLQKHFRLQTESWNQLVDPNDYIGGCLDVHLKWPV
ncbi:hypothetical protein CTI12_AA140710 [Artemisia annua]|uniref:Uncharacterized protein n=1 Tax=Artemisia annua TaxID=35608 RepID=A0A2U1PL92_ARTAN|nr:hypothetical protein CTI12_AA140710 [Artemisia annua]